MNLRAEVDDEVTVTDASPENEGELNAFIAMVERRPSMPEKHRMRYSPILDSQIVRGALGKGRSPSQVLNRGLRRCAALLLLTDCYLLLAWAILRWNWADTPGRRFK